MNTEISLAILKEISLLNKNLEEQNNLKKLELYHDLGAGFGSTLKGRYDLINKMDDGEKIHIKDLYSKETLKRIMGD